MGTFSRRRRSVPGRRSRGRRRRPYLGAPAGAIPAFISRHIRADERRLGTTAGPAHSGVQKPPYPGGCTPVWEGAPGRGRRMSAGGEVVEDVVGGGVLEVGPGVDGDDQVRDRDRPPGVAVAR